MQQPDSVTNFFTFLEARRVGIFVLLWSLVVFVFLLQWLAWIFSFGRFSRKTITGAGTGDGSPLAPRQNVRYIFSDAIVKIIDDFRHLLALLLVTIFAVALIFVLVQSRASIEGMKEGLTSVVAALGGLVGSIIGYYFGESSVTKALTGSPPDGGAGGGAQQPPPVQGAPEAARAEGIKRAPPPPGAGAAGPAGEG